MLCIKNVRRYSLDVMKVYQLKIADSDIQDVDLDSAAVTAPAQVIEVSVQGSVEGLPTIDAGQAMTKDNVIPVPLCATLITCANAPPLALTSNQLLLTSTSAATPLLVIGPSFPPRMQGPISMLPGAPIAFSGAPVAPPAPYHAIQSTRMPQGAALQPMAGMLWPSQSTPYASAFMAPPAWPMYVPCNMPRPPTQPAFMQAEFKELAEEMLELRQLHQFQETGALVRRNRHRDMLVARLHLRDPRPLQGLHLQGSR